MVQKGEHGSGCVPTCTAQFYFWVSTFTEGSLTLLNVAAFLEASFPQEGKGKQRE